MPSLFYLFLNEQLCLRRSSLPDNDQCSLLNGNFSRASNKFIAQTERNAAVQFCVFQRELELPQRHAGGVLAVTENRQKAVACGVFIQTGI